MAHHEAIHSVDKTADEIISLAATLKGGLGHIKTKFDEAIVEKEAAAKKIHESLEDLEKQLAHTSESHKEERARLEGLIAQKEAEQAKKVAELDANVRSALDERERVEREREAARGDAEAEKKRLATLLADLEDDAMSYSRLRPSKPKLDDADVAILRQMFLSSAVAGTGKLSFAELKQILAKYDANIPDGPLKKLFTLVEEDKKGRMSYITLVAVANDLAALVSDFRVIDLNKNNVLSRKEFREHFAKFGFSHKSVIDALFRFADEDESDEVTFSEYVYLSISLLALRVLYTAADSDKSGQLSKEETRTLLSDAKIPAAALAKYDQHYSVVDKDDNKILSYPEFVMLVLNMFTDD